MELVLAMALFGILNVMIFGLLQSGSRSFSIGMSRSSLQGDLNRSLARLQGEIRRSSASLLSVVADPSRVVDGCRRDGVCASSLSDWRANSSYSPNLTPLWDEYVVYYATLQQPGQLIRQTYRPAGSPFTQPMTGFTPATHMTDIPANHGFSTVVLAHHLEEFRLRYDGGSNILEVQLLLRRRAGLTPEGRRVNAERVQAHCQLRLSNP